jgi:glycosyltransferase involved in cell wall biosynthesis
MTNGFVIESDIMNPKFSIVIPTTGARSHLEGLLQSLSNLKEIENSEVLLVFNPADRVLSTISQRFEKLKVRIMTSQSGVNFARNVGIQNATGNILLFLDDDCRVHNPELLVQHAFFHQKCPWAFAVGGWYYNPNPSPLSQAYDEIQKDWLLRNRLSSDGECQMLLGGHFSVRNSGNIPLFDESIVYGGAETEYFFRLKALGYRFLLTNLQVEHSPQLTPSILAKKATLQGKTHHRLLSEGRFIEAPWVSSTSANENKYKDLYLRFFKNQFIRIENRTSKWAGVRKKLSLYHQKICFYLENRELF